MYARGPVTLRCLDVTDLDIVYSWHRDKGIEIAAGWVPPKPKPAFREQFEARLREPPDDFQWFGIEVDGGLVGRVDLAKIDREQGHAALGFFLGDREVQGRGHAKDACILMLDYGFHVENLARIYAHVFGFNRRSQGLLQSVGLQAEGVLRQHDLHNGARHDVHVFGMLRHEFDARYETVFTVPEDVL